MAGQRRRWRRRRGPSRRRARSPEGERAAVERPRLDALSPRACVVVASRRAATLFFSCRAPTKTAVRHLSPLGGGGDRELSDVCHPLVSFYFFYPVRVRNFGSKLGLGIKFYCVFRSPDLDLKALEDLALIPLLRSKKSSRVRPSGFSLL